MDETIDHYYEKIQEAAAFLRMRTSTTPKVGVVLGSGLGEVAEAVEDAVILPYGEIPHWPSSSVIGHAGRLLVGKLGGTPAAICQGRVHFYEGLPARDIAFPVRVLRALGAESFIVTNAAGCLRRKWPIPTLMMITDHINLLGTNPLTGINDERLGPRFPDMSHAYDVDLRAAARKAAGEMGIELKEGVYSAVAGPSYETPAEVRMLGTVGADAVGMSTVPEVIAAVHGGMRVLGISCLTNTAAGLLDGPLDHDEVLEHGKAASSDLAALIRKVIAGLQTAK